jgi:hypothetical protein
LENNSTVLEGYVTRWNSSFAKARGTLKNETPALMDISLFKMPDQVFSFFPHYTQWVNTLRVRHSWNKCPSTLPQRMLILGMPHSLRYPTWKWMKYWEA